ncbi:MAG TPA: DUF1614 domain-containing protein [Burkholderiales bacterium]|nr:DUF1614 domain-containing protein [Burkholderiales bacterium]
MTGSVHYFPVALPFLVVLAALLGIVMGMVAARLLSVASAGLGISTRSMLAVLVLSLLGSYINVPLAHLPERQVSAAAEVTYFGMRYVIPVITDWPATVIAINVGGAIIPILLSLYLMIRNRLYGLSLAGVVIVAAVCHQLAEPVPGLGIALPVFVPPLVSALVALLLSRQHGGALAYISGSLGTLIGADLLNLDNVRGLGAPIASIGGAGTFDGIFVTGLLAVIYAGLFTPRKSAR